MNSILTDGWGRENGSTRPVNEATFVEKDCDGTVTCDVSVSQFYLFIFYLLYIRTRGTYSA